VPLSDELKTVRDYLEIERVRFGNRLRFDLPADGGWTGVRVPRLSLQTLVENSVKYAVSPRREGASIAVRVDPIDGGVRLTVIDDGPGFDGSRLPANHGLALLRERLAANYGEAAALRVRTASGRCAVSLDLPAEVGARADCADTATPRAETGGGTPDADRGRDPGRGPGEGPRSDKCAPTS
jgi:LytS/YehU family sensor histidine kinase